jgi:hypothetical protein
MLSLETGGLGGDPETTRRLNLVAGEQAIRNAAWRQRREEAAAENPNEGKPDLSVWRPGSHGETPEPSGNGLWRTLSLPWERKKPGNQVPFGAAPGPRSRWRSCEVLPRLTLLADFPAGNSPNPRRLLHLKPGRPGTGA